MISNATKYTSRGKVLLGCRRRGSRLRIEVWDTGTEMPETKLSAIFKEFHQLDNQGGKRAKGLGLGLAIVQQLGDLLEAPISVRSCVGRGSVFAVDVPVVHAAAPVPAILEGAGSAKADGVARSSPGGVLARYSSSKTTLKSAIRSNCFSKPAAFARSSPAMEIKPLASRPTAA